MNILLRRPAVHGALLLRTRGRCSQRVRQLAQRRDLALLHDHWCVGLGLVGVARERDGGGGRAHGGRVPAKHSGAGGPFAAGRVAARGNQRSRRRREFRNAEERVSPVARLGRCARRALPARASTLPVARA